MRLFEDKLRAEIDSARHAESTIAYLDRSGRRVMGALRELLETWFARYPNAHRANLRGRLFSGRESEQQSAWWELYLHESFVRAGYTVQVSPATPDFTIEGPGGRFHVEATARFEDPDAQSRERREEALRDALDRTPTGLWRIGLELLSTGASSAPSARLRTRIAGWLRTLDFDKVRGEGRKKDPNGFERYPHKVFVDGDWAVGIEAWPVGKLRDDEGRARAIMTWGPGEMVLVQNEEPLRTSIARKASECRGLDAPLIIAVLLARHYGHEHQVESALFGVDGFEYSFDPDRLAVDGVREIRFPGGLWSPTDGDPDVAGVLAGVRLNHFNFPKIGPTLWTNPIGNRSSLEIAAELPWQRRWIDERGHAHASAIPVPADFFGVDRDWPGTED
ncbi:MAG: hypothetical protein NT062_36860 [Proteobacteria bacterium]|nr:hypothetical protein [Pseudomonadota bacterium]